MSTEEEVIDKVTEESGTTTRTRVVTPNRYKVILHNDNITTFDFVILLLVYVFHKTNDNAVDIAYEVHEKGYGIAGVYSYEIALEKVKESNNISSKFQFDLKVTIEEE